MAKDDDRFIKIFSQGKLNVTEIWVDRETGVNYLYHMSGYSGGLTVMVDQNGKPIVTPVSNYPY
ncbi:MAG TPA: xylan 1,4-beta-xylosidase [Clostridiaceae bacterium]|nr:xylan 1,4-beta-xylosidase [Clostridiaceae bacterium]